MENLKFRAWDKESQIMVYDDNYWLPSEKHTAKKWSKKQLEYSEKCYSVRITNLGIMYTKKLTNNEPYITLHNTNKDASYYSNWESKSITSHNIELMPSIGKHDKNGKEIFKEDIVNVRRYGQKKWEIGVVRYDPSYAHYYIHCHWDNNPKNDYYGIRFLECEEIEVIGNIRENPELQGAR